MSKVTKPPEITLSPTTATAKSNQAPKSFIVVTPYLMLFVKRQAGRKYRRRNPAHDTCCRGTYPPKGLQVEKDGEMSGATASPVDIHLQPSRPPRQSSATASTSRGSGGEAPTPLRKREKTAVGTAQNRSPA
jgi:hypothetical protein